jgi:hypothetical protein
MGSQLTLAASDIQRFERDGYVVVRQAFSPADGLAMQQRWWRELEDTHGIRPDSRSSWRQIAGDLKAAKRDPIQAKILTERVRGVFDDLLGKDAWSPPRDWGRPLPSRGRIDRSAGRHGLLPSRHGPLRRPEPGHAAALHADQDTGPRTRDLAGTTARLMSA